MIIKKNYPDSTQQNGEIAYLTVGKKKYEIRITLAFVVFIEDAYNKILNLRNEKQKPLLYFIERITENNFQIIFKEVQYLTIEILKYWFKIDDKTIDYYLTQVKTLEDRQTLSENIIYLLAVSQGGGDMVKKLLTCMAVVKNILEQDAKQVQQYNMTEQKFINNKHLH